MRAGAAGVVLAAGRPGEPKEAGQQGKECRVSKMSRRLRIEGTLFDLGRRGSFLPSQGRVGVRSISASLQVIATGQLRLNPMFPGHL